MSEDGTSSIPALPGLPMGSREELERDLDTRTRPSDADAERIASLTGLALRQAVYRATDAVSVFDDLLLQLQDDHFRLDEALETMDADVLTEDHDWHRVLHTLAAAGEEADQLRAVGLVKYRRYLRNRLQALEARQAAPAAGTPAAAPEPAVDATLVTTPGVGTSVVGALDLELEVQPEAPKERSPADSAPLELEDLDFAKDEVDLPAASAPAPAPAAAPERPKRLLRLRRGKPVALQVAELSEVELWLGKSRFRLALEGSLRLLSNRRECGRLREGRNLIGRSPDCEVVISGRHETVSRMHLEVRVKSGRLVSVTDLSSGGTYVRPELVSGRTHAA